MAEERRRGESVVSSDASKLDLGVVHRWRSGHSYRAPGIPRDVVTRAVAGSLNFGLDGDGGGRTRPQASDCSPTTERHRR